MRTSFLFLTMMAFASFAHASALVDKLETFTRQGVPAPAVQRALEFLDQNTGKDLILDGKKVRVRSEFLAIMDFSKDSTEKRLYLLDLKNDTVESFYVAHGKNSGVRLTTAFSNLANTKSSSLGFMLTGETYSGFHGRSMRLHGLENFNTNVYERYIVLHGAPYVSETFLNRFGRMGRSWGCPAVEKTVVDQLINSLKQGSLIYSYHPELMAQAQTSPNTQRVRNPSTQDDPNIDLPGEEEDMRSR